MGGRREVNGGQGVLRTDNWLDEYLGFAGSES
jgi:hypothetical protein